MDAIDRSIANLRVVAEELRWARCNPEDCHSPEEGPESREEMGPLEHADRHVDGALHLLQETVRILEEAH